MASLTLCTLYVVVPVSVPWTSLVQSEPALPRSDGSGLRWVLVCLLRDSNEVRVQITD